MKYQGYSAADFANDSFFIRWVRTPDDESDWFWRSFMKDNPDRISAIEEAKDLVANIHFPLHALETSELETMRNRMLMTLRAEQEECKDRNAIPTVHPERHRYFWMKVAASIMIIISVGGFFIKDDTISGRTAAELAQLSDGLERRSSQEGEKSVLVLDDGSKVWLNSASTIRFASNFEDRDTRDVYLEGEAFFEVAHDPRKPFVVHTSGIQVKVLGTSFNVRSYADEKTIETTLVTGRVQIEQPAGQGRSIGVLELKPSQRAEFNKLSKVLNVHEVVENVAGSWKEDRLVFDEASIEEVLRQLERWYGVRIHLAERENLVCKLSATIGKESLTDVLNLLQVSHRIRYTISEKDVFIEGAFCDE